jgi:hypothetical protein
MVSGKDQVFSVCNTAGRVTLARIHKDGASAAFFNSGCQVIRKISKRVRHGISLYHDELFEPSNSSVAYTKLKYIG